MPNSIVIQCQCGALQGRLSISRSDPPRRLTCYCDDCQAFANVLGQGDEILDAYGGTDIVQLSPASLSFGDYPRQLACLRLSPKGLMRWHARCCGTPIANTVASRQIPFAGIVSKTVTYGQSEDRLEDLFGRPRMGVFSRFAKGEPNQRNLHQGVPLSLVALSGGLIVKRWLKGDHNKTPFFNPETGKPICEPRNIAAGETPDVHLSEVSSNA